MRHGLLLCLSLCGRATNMRYIILFWFLPMSLFWGWFGLSYYDINFGTLFFSRGMHELVFGIYASTLNVQPETVVNLLIKACIVDTILIFGIFAYRKRAQIKQWWKQRRQASTATQPEMHSQVSPDPAE